MNPHLVLVFVAVILPFVAANYGSAGAYGGGAYGGSAGGVEDLINAAGQQQHGAASITAAGDVGAAPSAQAGLAHANAQLQSLNASPSFNSLRNSDSIAESLAENNLASNIRQGNVDIVAPNVVGQTAFRSLLVPNAINNHQVTATQPLQPIVVNQPGSPPAQVNSGPPAVVRAAPIVYKLKPSIIYQQEVVNKVPTPLSLNPVYVKVYKPGKQVDAPIAPSSLGGSSFGGGSFGGGPFGGGSFAGGSSGGDSFAGGPSGGGAFVGGSAGGGAFLGGSSGGGAFVGGPSGGGSFAGGSSAGGSFAGGSSGGASLAGGDGGFASSASYGGQPGY